MVGDLDVTDDALTSDGTQFGFSHRNIGVNDCGKFEGTTAATAITRMIVFDGPAHPVQRTQDPTGAHPPKDANSSVDQSLTQYTVTSSGGDTQSQGGETLSTGRFLILL